MTNPARDAASVIDLLTRYSFDLSGYTVDRLAEYWLQHYPSDWIRLAVIEALYQGRYKAVSVEQILNLWRRRGKPLHHFNRDFERIITPHLTKGQTVQSELIMIPPSYVPPVVKLELDIIEIEKPEFPKLIFPQTIGAIQPFSVSGISLPKEAMFRGFYAQGWEAGEFQEPVEAEPIEASPGEHLEAIASSLIPMDSEPVFFPEQAIVEFKSMPDLAIKRLPIQPFKPSGDEISVGSLEIAPQVKDLGSPPIHQFVPTLAPSEFYAKLKAIVQNAATSKLAKSSQNAELSNPSPPSKP